MIADLPRKTLFYRHQLSHQQIDDILNESRSNEFPEAKAENLYKFKQFTEIISSLQNNSISFICLKGPVLAYKLYKDPTYRNIGDIDLLIEFKDLSRCVSLLNQKGFKQINNDSCRNRIIRSTGKKFLNQNLLHNPVTNINLELHWALIPHPPVSPLKLKEIVNNNLIDIELSGLHYKTLNNELELLFLIIHGGFHRWRRLKWLIDVYEYSRQGIYAKERFLSLSGELKAKRMGGLANKLLNEFIPGSPQLPGANNAPEFMVRESLRKINNHSDAEHESFPDLVKYFFFLFNAFPGISYKLRMIKFLFYYLLHNLLIKITPTRI